MRLLIDELFPPAVAELLADRHGHDAVHVTEVGLGATEDSAVAAAAREQDRALVTENVVHFADERDLVLVFVHKRSLPAGGAQASALAELVDDWATDHPAPYQGPHWPARETAAGRGRCEPRGQGAQVAASAGTPGQALNAVSSAGSDLRSLLPET